MARYPEPVTWRQHLAYRDAEARGQAASPGCAETWPS